MDEPHLVRGARYAELDPVAVRPEDYAWSCARLHLGRRKTDPLNTDHRVVKIMGGWRAFLREGVSEDGRGLSPLR